MEASAVNPINGGVNASNAGIGSNLYGSSSITANSSPIPGGGINPFAGDGGSQLQQLIFTRLKLVLGENFFKDTDNALAAGINPFAGNGSPIVGGGTNPFAGNGSPIVGGGTNPFAGNGIPIVDTESLLQRSPFDPLREVLGNNIPFSNGGNTSNVTSPTFDESKAPVGNGNKNFGSDNATIGNSNSNYGSNSATIGNGNWNFNNENATIGNGNWLFGKDNTTLGNGNWYWDNGSSNATLGNGNWHFGSDNATIGNGNWDFGSNNTIIGNGNWVFTSGNEIVGNGKWLVDNDNNTNGLELSSQGIKTDVNNLIDSLIGRIGQDFLVLTGDFDVSSTETFNRLISSRSVNVNDTDISNYIERLLPSLSVIQGNADYYPVPNSQSVPESASSVSLVVMGLMCLLLSVFKKQQHS